MQPIAPRRRNRTKCSYRLTLDCPRLTTRSHAMRFFLPFWTQTSCVPRATMPSLVHNLLFHRIYSYLRLIRLRIFHNSRLCTKGSMAAIIIATMSLVVHTTFRVQIGGKNLIACERVVSNGQSSVGRYEHFTR